MPTRFPVIWSLIAVLSACASASTEYEAMVANAKRGAPTDYQKLRFDMAAQPRFNPYETEVEPFRKAMRAAVSAERFDEARRAALAVTERLFGDLEAHVVLSNVCRKLGDNACAETEDRIATGLLHSMSDAHDGLDIAHAIPVISVAEEYEFLAAVGGKPKGQALVSDDGHSFDELTVDFPNKQNVPVYFNIDVLMTLEMKIFGFQGGPP